MTRTRLQRGIRPIGSQNSGSSPRYSIRAHEADMLCLNGRRVTSFAAPGEKIEELF